MVSARFEDLYRAARRRAALIDRSDRGRIIVTGPDRASFLQGLLTNDMAALKAGQGCYAAYLTPQGRMITDVYVYELGDAMLLSVPRERKDMLLAKLDHFIFSEDVQLGDVTDSFAQIAVVGPESAAALGGVLDAAPRDALMALIEHGNMRTRLAGAPAIVARVTDTGEPGFDVSVETSGIGALKSRLAAADTVELSAEVAETLRIESGVPRFGIDMDEETIPLEAGIEDRAISFTKGCYVGQEVIIRVLHRGHGRVARKLVGLRIEGGSAPAAGVAVRAADREIGHVTSSTISPVLEQPIALAYLYRDFLTPGTAVTIDGVRGVVTELPFVRRQV